MSDIRFAAAHLAASGLILAALPACSILAVAATLINLIQPMPSEPPTS